MIRLLAFLTCLTLSFPALAQPAPEELVKFQVLPERTQITSGDEIWIGVEQLIRPHWHTYWKNPGDSGTPSTVKWTLPEGFEISEIHWPTPEKVPYPPLLNYGYNNQVTLLQKLSAPQDLPAGEITLRADIEVLACEDTCIPVTETVELTLNNGITQDNTATLAQARTRLPQPVDWPAHFKASNNDIIMTFTLPEDHGLSNTTLRSAAFVPESWGLLNNAALVDMGWNSITRELTLVQAKGSRSLDEIGEVKGVLTFKTRDFLLGFEIGTPTPKPSTKAIAPTPKEVTTQPTQPTPQSDTTNAAAPISFIAAILGAVLGGLILNLMPCVFPVLSIKALSLVKIAKDHPHRAQAHGLSYSAGVISSFVAIAAILIALKSGGASIGWGFQLQNPIVVTLLIYLFFIIGLNLSGAFEIRGHFGNFGNRLTKGDGLMSAFFTGILATLVATPCTAPFMAASIGVALTQPPTISLSIFAALGLGLALPYLVLSFIPALQKFLPKAGSWMETFRQFLAFPMFASCAWLLWVLDQQVSDFSGLLVLIGLVLIAFALWLIQRSIKLLGLAVLVFAILCLPFTEPMNMEPQMQEQLGLKLHSTPYNAATLSEALDSDNPVFVEMTAAWCITCKVNHATSINTTHTKRAFSAQNVTYIVGDWTNKDEMITEYLQSFERSGVPLYVFYGAPDAQTGKRPQPVILPQILTPGIVTKTIMGTN